MDSEWTVDGVWIVDGEVDFVGLLLFSVVAALRHGPHWVSLWWSTVHYVLRN